MEEFIIFWNSYKCLSNLKNRRNACLEAWSKLDEPDRVVAMEMAKRHEHKDNPYFWLVDMKFYEELEADMSISPTTESSNSSSDVTFYNVDDANDLIIAGHTLVWAKVHEPNDWKLCDKHTAETNGWPMGEKLRVRD